MTISLSEKASAQIYEMQVNLPQLIGEHSLSDSVGKVDSRNIFEYMDGAGELYLGYQFDHLDVNEYKKAEKSSILVELYFMKSSGDAFGLLSLDWGGESISLNNLPQYESTSSVAPSSRALYGAGLLRIWADHIYARVMAYQVTPDAEAAVFAIGRAIAANRNNPVPPPLLQVVPDFENSDLKLLNDRIQFFRSYLVLNSFYYLSHQNILKLDLSTEAVAATYEIMAKTGEPKRVQFLVVKYKNAERARQALHHFYEMYLPEQQESYAQENNSHFYEVENGWVGYLIIGEYVTLVFDCPDPETGRLIFNRIEPNLKYLEDNHGK